MNKIINLYQTFFSSRENNIAEDMIRKFIQKAEQDGNLAFDSDVIRQYIKDPRFVEKKIISDILRIEKIDLDIDYFSLYKKQMNASSITSGRDKAIVVDELWSYTALSFFLTIFSLIYDHGEKNFTRCIKNCFVMLDLQGKRHQIGVHNLKDINLMISLPRNIINLVLDSFWTAWTFMIGHELYHLTVKSSSVSALQEEMDADAYGYKVLITMMEAQKQENISKEICIFYEDYYLSPIMLFEYFRFLDLYRVMCNEKIEYIDYPSPQQRQEQIFNLFDAYIPDTFNTKIGNELLNYFFDAVDQLQTQIILKKEKGKLDIF